MTNSDTLKFENWCAEGIYVEPVTVYLPPSPRLPEIEDLDDDEDDLDPEFT